MMPRTARQGQIVLERDAIHAIMTVIGA